VENFIYLLEHDVEHVLRNVEPFRFVMKGSKNLSHGNRIRHLLELEIKHKHGGFNINYEKATVVWQQFGFGS
jgi:hypothetical protein